MIDIKLLDRSDLLYLPTIGWSTTISSFISYLIISYSNILIYPNPAIHTSTNNTVSIRSAK